jgi:hypothetical protein
MINAFVELTRTVMLALGATLVTWSTALILARQNDEQFEHFFRLFVGYLLLAFLWELMLV